LRESLRLIQMELADQIPEFVKVAIAEMQKLNATDDEKREFIAAVKRARDGDAEDFFQAQDDINKLLDRIKNKPAAPKIQIGMVEADNASKSKDLLAAAKDMCNALSKLNLAMED